MAGRVFLGKKLTHNNELIMFVYHTKRRDQYYDKVISIYQETGYGRKRISKMVPVGEKTIARWIANFVAENGRVFPSPQIVMQKPQVTTSPQDTSSDVQGLRNRIKELEAQLLQAEIKAEFYDEMINVAEAKFKIPIRKKAGAKQ